MRKGPLKPYKSLIRILGKNGIYNLCFDVSEWPLSRKQAVALNKAQEELPSSSDITGMDDIELQEIAEMYVCLSVCPHVISMIRPNIADIKNTWMSVFFFV